MHQQILTQAALMIVVTGGASMVRRRAMECGALKDLGINQPSEHWTTLTFNSGDVGAPGHFELRRNSS